MDADRPAYWSARSSGTCYAENRSARTVTTYLIAVRQADAFLRGRGTSLEAATRGRPRGVHGRPARHSASSLVTP
jgi:hypothetical protein